MSKKCALALVPALIAISGCTTIGEWTRTAVGLNEQPVRTEPTLDRNQLVEAGLLARANLYRGVQVLANDPSNATKVNDVLNRAEEYYYIGRLAMRSQCEGYLQTLATVDSQTTFGQDLANNFFDTATIGATISGSPTIWATGLSAVQNSLNSVNGSAERFLLLTDSVGALRERVLQRMEDEEGIPPRFDNLRNQQPLNAAVAFEAADESIQAIQRYGAPCTEAGLRLIISEALSANGLQQDADRARQYSYLNIMIDIINEKVREDDQRYTLSDQDLQWLYIWALINPDADGDPGHIRALVETKLPYLRNMDPSDEQRLAYNIQELAAQRSDITRNIADVRTALLEEHTANQPRPASPPTPPTQPDSPADDGAPAPGN